MLRVAVIGAGYFSRFQISAWARMDGITLTGIADIDAETRARLASDFPHVQIFEDADQMVSSLMPDVIDIATPPATHADLIRSFTDRVPTLICQKPFCRSLEEARQVVGSLGETKLLIHENFRFQPWYREIHRLIHQHRLGDIRQARFALRPGDGEGPDAYLDRQPYFRDMPHFLIRETGIHYVDTFRFLFGEPVALYADLRRTNPVVAGEDSGQVIFEQPNGARITFDGNRTLDHVARNPRLTMGELEIEGSDASLSLTGDGEIFLRDRGSNDWQQHLYPFEDLDFGGNCVEALQTHFRDCLSDGDLPETAAQDYLRNLEIETLIYRSSKEGRRLTLAEEIA